FPRPEGPRRLVEVCVKGLPGPSWSAFTQARSSRFVYLPNGEEHHLPMDHLSPLPLTAWAVAAFPDLPARRRVLSALALAALHHFGPPLVHLGVALARCGLEEAAVSVAARGVVPLGVRYSAFIGSGGGGGGGRGPAGGFPPGMQAWYVGCLRELAPVFVRVLGRIEEREMGEKQGAKAGGGAEKQQQVEAEEEEQREA
ncbi:hypothetical protein Agub_g11105, partial [Astrephomene gubernaculifera]